MDGDLGPIWISAGGGGLGSLGELGIAMSAARMGCDRGSNEDVDGYERRWVLSALLIWCCILYLLCRGHRWQFSTSGVIIGFVQSQYSSKIQDR